MSTAKAKKHLEIVPAPTPIEAVDNKFQAVFEKASDAILTVLPNGKIDEVNEAFENLTDYLKSELMGSDYSLLIPDPQKTTISSRTRPLSKEMIFTSGTYEDVAVLRKDAYVKVVDLVVREVKSQNNRFSVLLFRDVSEKKKLERELLTKHSELTNAYFQLEKTNVELKSMQETLVQSGKMAALGELAAGIAHELNQPLQGIRGYAQEMRDIVLPYVEENAKGTDPAHVAAVGFKEIITNVDKMAKIIQYLRTFTRKSTEDFEMVDVHFAIEESLKMLDRQFKSRGIQVHRDFQKDLTQIYSNPVQLEQIFINFSTNARDAIEETARGSGNVWIKSSLKGEFVEVTYRDDGCGMSEKTKAKIFNPFFTTKEVGKGMGLGLSLSYGILNKLHGSILVQSEIGKGTTFTIRLPRDFRELG